MRSDGQPDVERELAAVATLDVLQRPYVNSAYATGSLLAGLGTRTSDIDVVLLVEADARKELAKQDKALRRHDPSRSDWAERVDFQVFTVDEFTEMVDTCMDYAATWDAGRVYTIGPALRVLSQFTAAARMVKPSAALTELSQRIAAHRSALVQLSIAHTVLYANNTHEDLVGLIAEKDDIAVLRLSHRHLELGLDAWCTAQGLIYPDVKFKWLWRRLGRAVTSERELSALRELYVPETATGPTHDVGLRRVDTTQALLAQALLAAWATDPSSLALPILSRWDTAEPTLWRCSDWMPIRTSDAWRLGADFRFLRFPVAAAVVWACAGGRPDSEVETIVVAQCRAAFGLDIDRTGARAAIDQLLECGALRRGDFSAITASQFSP